eukprot:15009757-Alexandrium_andersonii.AAC.1
MSASLVGSEMCIRDRAAGFSGRLRGTVPWKGALGQGARRRRFAVPQVAAKAYSPTAQHPVTSLWGVS